MVNSYHTISLASRIKVTSELCLLMLQENSSSISKGNYKREWVVRPPGSMGTTTPEVVVDKEKNLLIV